MKDLLVVVDLSGSMYVMGKSFIIGNILSTLSLLEKNEEISIKKIKWDGSGKSFEEIAEKCSGKNTLLLTDGYSLSDNCRGKRSVKTFFEQNVNNFFIVLCGGDSLDITSSKEFSRVHSVKADNILQAIESFSWDNGEKSEEDGEDWE